jgi:hypothetical protein
MLGEQIADQLAATVDIGFLEDCLDMVRTVCAEMYSWPAICLVARPRASMSTISSSR